MSEPANDVDTDLDAGGTINSVAGEASANIFGPYISYNPFVYRESSPLVEDMAFVNSSDTDTFPNETTSEYPFPYVDPFNLGYELRLANFGGANVTGETFYVLEYDLWRDIPLGVVLSILCLLTFVGNAMVLHAVRTERRLQTVSQNVCIYYLFILLFVLITQVILSSTEDISMSFNFLLFLLFNNT